MTAQQEVARIIALIEQAEGLALRAAERPGRDYLAIVARRLDTVAAFVRVFSEATP